MENQITASESLDDLEIIDLNANSLNLEAEEVLAYQVDQIPSEGEDSNR